MSPPCDTPITQQADTTGIQDNTAVTQPPCHPLVAQQADTSSPSAEPHTIPPPCDHPVTPQADTAGSTPPARLLHSGGKSKDPGSLKLRGLVSSFAIHAATR